MARRISQREARRLRQRVEELERLEHQRRNAFVSDWPGVNIATLMCADVASKVHVARLLEHAVCVQERNNELRFYAVPLRGE